MRRLVLLAVTVVLVLGVPVSPASAGCVISGSVSGVSVPAGQTCEVEGLVESTGNFVVRGTLVMRPGDTLRFVGVNESAFVGGGEDPVASDVGLWVVGGGVLDAQGTPKTGWLRSAAGVAAGASSLTLESAPAGWQAGDEVVVVPTRAGDYTGFEVRRLASVSGATVTLDSPLSLAHPAVDGLTPEVANLTRDVRIEGTTTGRSHVFIRSSEPQSIRGVGIRHVGPRPGRFVPGRYGLHFHHMFDASRGSLIEDVVIRDSGSHSFVPHGSHGITIRDSVAFNVFKDAYWWDRPPNNACNCGNDTRDSLWEHLLAARVNGYGGEDLRVSGFLLGSSGTGGGNRTLRTPRNNGLPFSNVIRDSVAVGVYNSSSSSARFAGGFHWPDSESEPWEFSQRIVAHNNRVGLFIWSTDPWWHDVNTPRVYHNDLNVVHGAYRNVYHYADLRSYGARQAGFQLHATSGDGGAFPRVLELHRVSVEAAPIGLLFEDRPVAGERRGRLVGWTFRNVARPIVFRDAEGPAGGDYDLHDFTVDGRPLRCTDVTIETIHSRTLVRVYEGGVLRFTVTARGCA